MRITKIILTIILAFFILHACYIIIDGLYDKNGSAPLAIVLGNKVNEDGTLSTRLAERLNKSIELYKEDRVKCILVSGGLGKEGYWEGEKMKEYLLEHHIPNESIIVDNDGFNTEKTVVNALHVMDSMQLKSAITVSQYFHQTRIKALFRKYGFKAIESSSPTYFELRDVYAIPREMVAYYAMFLF
jgi:vancomycin permeability regulator SanA